MTKFHSRLFGVCAAASLVPFLAGCGTPSGVPVSAIAQPDVAAAYLPLFARIHLGLDRAVGAAMVIAPGIAVTNDHNDNLVDRKLVLGFGSLSDLMFFRTSRKAAPHTAVPVVGQSVTAYGQDVDGKLRVAHGIICDIVHVAGFSDSPYFIFAGNAGPGFSGGPVLDANGHLVGITWGYVNDAQTKKRLIFAYDMKRVSAEFHLMKPQKYEPEDGASSPADTSNCDSPSRKSSK